VCGSATLELFPFGHGCKSEHILFGFMVLFDVGVKCGVGEVGFAA